MFLHRLIDLTKSVSMPNHRVTLNKDARRDLASWLLFVEHVNGQNLFLQEKWAKTYELISTDEKSVTYKHCNDIVSKFAVGITEGQEKFPTFYWLLKLHKRSYKARFKANCSSCTTTSLSKVVTSCLTAIKNHWIKYCEKTYEREGINN